MLHPTLTKVGADGKSWADHLRKVTGGYQIEVDTLGNHVLTGPKVVFGDQWIPESYTQPVIIPRLAILHTNAGPRKTPWRALWNYIRRIDITGEMHFQVEMDGAIANLMPLNRRADCNYKANSFRIAGSTKLYGAISFETQDLGYPTLDTTPWTVEQIESIVAALTCISVVYGVACTAPGSWNDTGIGHHILYPNDWTNVKGKTCPGKARIRQMDYIRYRVANNLAVFSDLSGWVCRGSNR